MHPDIRLKQATRLIKGYRFQQPLIQYLKEAYKKDSRLGSRDRKQISQMVFAHYRLGQADIPDLEQRMLIGCFLSADSSARWIQASLEEKTSLKAEDLDGNIDHKISLVSQATSLDFPSAIFNNHPELSEGVSLEMLSKSFLQQPAVFARIFSEREFVLSELKRNKLDYEPIGEHGLSFPADSKLTQLISWRKGYLEIQDINSQATSELMNPGPNEFWWDCCAGGGGKSLLLAHKEPSVRILASDRRKSVLKQYSERMEKHGFGAYAYQKLDLSVEHNPDMPTFDGIICDAPCSGSGTWARSPEYLQTLKPEQIEKHADLQLRIAKHAVQSLKPGKDLLYITCSVFKQENEDVVAALVRSGELELQESKMFNGTDIGADSLFAARLVKKAL